MQDPLASLRDIHLPDAPGLWPLAIGWWIVILAILFSLMCFFLWQSKRNRKIQSEIETDITEDFSEDLHRIIKDFDNHQNNVLLVQQVSMLLRKVSMTDSRNHAAITGNDWLAALDKRFDTNKFTQQYVKLFQQQQYAGQVEIDIKSFIHFIEECLSKNSKNYA